eukprot:m51a1_g9306 hypothetical protein (189) ;mRNA; r:83034-83600
MSGAADEGGTEEERKRLARILDEHARQVETFSHWAARHDWRSFHHSHFDWWAFPVDELSSYGDEYTVTPWIAAQLRRNGEYTRRFDYGVRLAALAWGWNADKGAPVERPEAAKGQAWACWPVRLYKMGVACMVAQRVELYRSLRQLALSIEKTRGRRGLTFSSTNTGKTEHVIDRWDLRQHEFKIDDN